MKISFSKDLLKIVDNFQKRTDDIAKEALNKVVDNAVVYSQNAYDKFTFEMPTDDPYIWVESSQIASEGKHKFSRRITATGNTKALYFAEFGAGVYYYTDVETRLYQDIIPNPRPAGIDEIGQYHLAVGAKSRGQDDGWFYKSELGRESENAHFVKVNSRGEQIMYTHGNRPARALYRGVGMATRRLLGGKLK